MGQDNIDETPQSLAKRLTIERIQEEVYDSVFVAFRTARAWEPPEPKRPWTAHELVQAFRAVPKFESSDDEYEFTDEIYNATFRLIQQLQFRRFTPIRYWFSERAFLAKSGTGNARKELWYRSVASTFNTWRLDAAGQYIARKDENIQAQIDQLEIDRQRTLEGMDTEGAPDKFKHISLRLRSLNLEIACLFDVEFALDGNAWDAFTDEQVDLLREWLKQMELPYRRADVISVSRWTFLGSMDGVVRYRLRSPSTLFEFDS